MVVDGKFVDKMLTYIYKCVMIKIWIIDIGVQKQLCR